MDVLRCRGEWTYKVVHKGSALDENGGVVGEGGLVDVGTVLSDMSAIVDEPLFVIDVVDVPEPLPRFLGVFRIRFISSVSRKTRADVEEASVGNGCKG